MLVLLLVFAGALGALRPRQAWLSGLVIGVTIAAARATGVLLGHVPADPHAPRSLPAVATLLVLVVPAVLAAFLGVAVRRAVQRTDSPRTPRSG